MAAIDVYSLSNSQIQRYIRDAAKDSSRVVFTTHVEQRMSQRRITNTQVMQCLQKGNLNGTPEPNAAKGSLECDMRHFCAGHNIKVVVAISNDYPDLILVTVMVVNR